MNSEVEFHIRQNNPWIKLPENVKQSLGNSQKEYEKCIVNFSIKNQLRYKGNLIKHVRKDQRKYYEDLLAYSKESLMLYPYHLSDIVVTGLRVTPFQYYVSVMETIMEQEKSYDSLPNFTAADCLRLLGIGRNEYIELMNQCRSGRKLFRRRHIKELLPPRPAEIPLEPWWLVHIGCVIEEDIKLVSASEKDLIDRLIDHGPQKAGDLDHSLVKSLYKKGLIYLDVPISDDDLIVVPPLEGFVMNRVLGDYFETLLYKIFVSIDENTSVGELANVLQIDSQAVKHAVSLYCRLGFARKKNQENDANDFHPSWASRGGITPKPSLSTEDTLLGDLAAALREAAAGATPPEETSSGTDETENFLSTSTGSKNTKRIAFLFDSTLTAFLMMGNLSPGLKNHAVTMFEVGKLSDESLDSFLAELEKVSTDDSEGEAQRYFDHALVLRSTILFLRHNRQLDTHGLCLPLDLIRCESLQSLDPATCTRLLNKNYSLLVSMAPLSKEIRPIASCVPPHLGPAIPEVNTVWFKLFLYDATGYGPASLLLSKGTRLRRLPSIFHSCDKLLVTTWGHDPGVLPTNNILFAVNDALCHSAVFIQASGGGRTGAETVLVPFPINESDPWAKHPVITRLSETIDLKHNCGYITLVNLNKENSAPSLTDVLIPPNTTSPINGFVGADGAKVLNEELDKLSPRWRDSENENRWTLLDCCFGVPLFDAVTNNAVCETIINSGLGVPESLAKLTSKSRSLCLRLLEFIAQFQDLPVLSEETNTSTSKRAAASISSVVLPTRCLIFQDGVLRTFHTGQ